MPAFKPIKRSELIYHLKQFGFDGPFSGGKHQFLIKDRITLVLPNPHKTDIGKELLARILKQANISRQLWEEL